jgi:hypothetical protein
MAPVLIDFAHLPLKMFCVATPQLVLVERLAV